MASPVASGPTILTGADGVVGYRLERSLRTRGDEVIAISRRSGGSLSRIRYDLALPIEASLLPSQIGKGYLLAAQTSMTICEQQPDVTYALNVTRTLELAKLLHKRGAHIIVVSTNLVLDGRAPHATPDSPICPQNHYSAQKAQLEMELLEQVQGASVLRTTKIAESLRGLLVNWRDTLASGGTIRPFSDLVCAPLPLGYLVDALVRLGDTRYRGLFQIGADRDLNYVEIGLRLAAAMGIKPTQVAGSTSTKMGVQLSARPNFTTLASDATEKLLGLPPVDAVASVDAVIEDVLRR